MTLPHPANNPVFPAWPDGLTLTVMLNFRWRKNETRRALALGRIVSDGEVTRREEKLSDTRRMQHIAILGKTGTGKSSLLRSFCEQDIQQGRGFAYFDLHGDATPFILRRVALEEQRKKCDLSSRLIVLDPSDPDWSAGLNVLAGDTRSRFVQVAEFTELLKRRWHLDSLGARTEELLRNSLHVLAENGLTLLELEPLLVNAAFRSVCLQRSLNPDIKQYFEARYNAMSNGMQIMVREPILNKTSAFTADPHFRHILGQQKSTVSLSEAMENGYWVVLNLHKGRLGEEAVTLGSLFLSMIKHSLFSRTTRQLFTLYCDEIQNLVSYDSGLDTILSESRKFGISVVSANQFLEQYPAKMRAAILAVGTQIFFQLASADAQHIASTLDGGRPLSDLLENLPRGHMVVKTGSEHWEELRARRIYDPNVNVSSLYDRCRERWTRPRSEVEDDIAHRYELIDRVREW